MAKKKSEMSETEINHYWDAYFAAVDTLIDAQSKVEALEGAATDLGERSGFRADRLRIEADIELMRARRIAFNANSVRVNPPEASVVAAIKDLASKVAAQTVRRNRAAAIVSLAAEAMTKFSQIQSAS